MAPKYGKYLRLLTNLCRYTLMVGPQDGGFFGLITGYAYGRVPKPNSFLVHWQIQGVPPKSKGSVY